MTTETTGNEVSGGLPCSTSSTKRKRTRDMIGFEAFIANPPSRPVETLSCEFDPDGAAESFPEWLLSGNAIRQTTDGWELKQGNGYVPLRKGDFVMKDSFADRIPEWYVVTPEDIAETAPEL